MATRYVRICHAGSPLVAVAQLVRAPGCGPGGRGFKSPRSPQNFTFDEWRGPGWYAARIATSGVTRGWCLAMSELGNGLGVAGPVQGSSDIFEASRESRTPAGETIEDRAVR